MCSKDLDKLPTFFVGSFCQKIGTLSFFVGVQGAGEQVRCRGVEAKLRHPTFLVGFVQKVGSLSKSFEHIEGARKMGRMLESHSLLFCENSLLLNDP